MRASGIQAEKASSGGPLLPEAAGSVGIGVLLFVVVASSIAGSGAVFSVTLILTWILLPALVGLRNTLDAGCAFMVVALGTAMVTTLARNGPGWFFH